MVFKALYVEDVCLCVFPLPVQNVVYYDALLFLQRSFDIELFYLLVFIGYLFKCLFY
jgi:hypothetical protein